MTRWRLKFFLLCLGLALPLCAEAQPMVSVGGAVAFEYDSNGRTYETRQPILLRGGYRFKEVDAYVEYSYFKTSDSESMVEIERGHHEFIAWGRRILVPEWTVAPYAALGIGTQYDVIQTTFNGESARASGDYVPLIAGAFGFELVLPKNFDVILESRIAKSRNYSPDPLLSFALAVGYLF